MQKKYTYSVGIATYNGERFIREQLTSVINQSLLPTEIIVSDDGSTDCTIKIVKEVLSSYSGKFRVLTTNRNQGLKKNIEKIVSESNTEWLFLCDQDDFWELDKIEKFNDFINTKKEDNISLVLSDGWVTDKKLNHKYGLFESLKIFPSMYKDGILANPFQILFKRNIFTGASLMVRTQVAQDAIPFSQSSEALHDYWLGIVSCIKGKVGIIDEKLFLYRQHGHNTIGAKDKGFYLKIKGVKRDIVSSFSDAKGRYELSLDLENSMLVKDPDLLMQIEKWKQFNLARYSMSVERNSIFNDIRKLLFLNYRKYGRSPASKLGDILNIVFCRRKCR